MSGKYLNGRLTDFSLCSLLVISPTHKRTEGRAPCGALSLLQKTPHYRGVGEIGARLNVKLCVLVVVVPASHLTLFLAQSSSHGN